jgi:hypothetical protein
MIKDAINYIAIGDFVPYLNPVSFMASAVQGFSNIEYLPFRLQTPFQAHAWAGPSYQYAIDKFIRGQ